MHSRNSFEADGGGWHVENVKFINIAAIALQVFSYRNEPKLAAAAQGPVRFHTAVPSIAARSLSAVVIGWMLNFSTKTLSTLGVMNAGRLGPKRMFLMPR